MEKIGDYVRTLKTNYNLILNGAPGTGKTYLAKQLAAQIIFDGNVPKNFEEHPQFVERCGFVQFHPSYDYTDFVEGLRPTRPNQDGNIGFERKDGIFKDFCKKAYTRSDIKFSTNSMEFTETETYSERDDFDSLYNSLLEDIRHKRITEMVSKTGIRYKLEVGSGGNIRISSGNDKPAKSVNVKNTMILFDHLIREKIYDIPHEWTARHYFNIISKDPEGPDTIDYKNYEWVLRNLLTRYKHVHSETFKEETHSKIFIDSDSIRLDAEVNKKKETKPYIFIIDEINRGEISKIFGELFFSIDPGYRGKKGKVQTQYQNLIGDDDPFKDGFYIPENVYIIGTMNDIDRSVECMDFAMRRRFTFKEITAAESAVNMGLSNEATARMTRLNDAISEIDGFNSSFHIGAAYFCDVEDYDELWDLKLQGLLKEYLRGMPDAEESLEALRKAYYLSEE